LRQAGSKTTILPELLTRMAGWCAVFDVDWLIDPLGRASGDGQVDWAAFRDTWLHVAHGVADQTGFGRWLRDHLEPVIDTTTQSWPPADGNRDRPQRDRP
jgi:hypothetical protein